MVKSYSADERRLAQFVAKMNLKAVSERSCSSVTEVMLEVMYYGVKGFEAVKAIVQSGFFGDVGTISSDLSHSRELLFAKSNASGAAKIDKVKTVSAKAYIQQEKELSWGEVLEYAAYKSPEDREWVEKVKELLENPYIPSEAKNSMIEALRPKAIDMWNILENSPIPSTDKEKIKSQSYEKNTDKDTKSEVTNKTGPSATIPEDKGTIISYMGYHKITAKSSLQYKLREDAQNNNRYSIKKPEYYALIDDRIVIATKPNIGGNFEVSIGDYLDVTFENSDGSISVYKCILGDVKGGDAPNPWGHYDGKGVVEIIYHDYNPPEAEGYNKNANNPWGKGKVISITKVGNYSQNQ